MKTIWHLLAGVSIATAALTGCGSSGDDSPLTYQGEQPGSGARVELRSTELSESVARFDVHAFDLKDVYALSFRLRYDAERFQFASATPNAGAAAEGAIVLAKEAAPGLLFVVVSARGVSAGSAWPDTSIMELRFERKDPSKGSRFAFEASRSRIVDPNGKLQPNIGWIGGEVR